MFGGDIHLRINDNQQDSALPVSEALKLLSVFRKSQIHNVGKKVMYLFELQRIWFILPNFKIYLSRLTMKNIFTEVFSLRFMGQINQGNS